METLAESPISHLSAHREDWSLAFVFFGEEESDPEDEFMLAFYEASDTYGLWCVVYTESD